MEIWLLVRSCPEYTKILQIISCWKCSDFMSVCLSAFWFSLFLTECALIVPNKLVWLGEALPTGVHWYWAHLKIGTQELRTDLISHPIIMYLLLCIFHICFFICLFVCLLQFLILSSWLSYVLVGSKLISLVFSSFRFKIGTHTSWQSYVSFSWLLVAAVFFSTLKHRSW